MWLRRIAVPLLALCSLFAAPLPLGAEEFRIALYDEDDSYMVGVLRLALKAQGGDHSVIEILHPVPQSRAMRELADGRADFNIFYTGYSVEREQTLTQVNIPLSRGLLGYRFLAILAANQEVLKAVHSFDDLARTVTFGSNASWPDTPIMRGAGLEVVTAPTDTLWPMLKRRRFLAFPRGMSEIAPELTRENADLQAPLIADPWVMLAYRYDTFFYVAHRDSQLAEIIEDGLKRAYDDGSFMDHFQHHPVIRASLDEFAAHPRRIFWLKSPNMSEATKAIPDKYWHHLDAEMPDLPSHPEE